jgi:hypothetical protein
VRRTANPNIWVQTDHLSRTYLRSRFSRKLAGQQREALAYPARDEVILPSVSEDITREQTF